MKNQTKKVTQEILAQKNEEKKEILQRFFKTGKGEYAEGDLFLGVMVPNVRRIVKKYNAELNEIQELIRNKYHEIRLCGFLLLVKKYEQTKKQNKKQETKKIIDFYLINLKHANNWDLVDLSCYKILGDYLTQNKKERKILYKLAKSKNMWERRTSIVSTMTLIKKGELQDTYNISKELLNDKEDLMHKAVGWLLREAGKKDKKQLEKFLQKNIKKIPRTTLRYAIEKFPEHERQKYLKL